jgi:hypothetical protein
MKKIILSFLLIASIKSFSQQENIQLSVEELNVSDTAFNQHPVRLSVQIRQLNDTYDTAIVYCETFFERENLDMSVYISQETITKSVVKIPLIYFKQAFGADGSIDTTVANAILSQFKLKLR